MSEHTPLPKRLFLQTHKPDHLRGQDRHKVQQWVWGWRRRLVLRMMLAILLLDASWFLFTLKELLYWDLLSFQWKTLAKAQLSWVAVSSKAISTKKDIRKMSLSLISIGPQCQWNLPTENEMHFDGCCGSCGQDYWLRKQMVGFLDLALII